MGTKIYVFSKYIYNFFYLNVLWIFFTLSGFVLLGFVPSTITVYTMFRKQFQNGDFEIGFHKFYLEYKKNFVPMIKPTFMMGFIFLVLMINYEFTLDLVGIKFQIIQVILILSMVVTILYCLTFFAVHAYFDLDFKRGLLLPLEILLSNPILSIVSLIIFSLGEYAVMYSSGAYVLFLISVPSYFCMKLYYRYFEKLVLRSIN
ncbi:YesL family protein [Enterococcus sp.]|uniref:YesL family protein n=1 Tax=Enterococcus sp. TaxID=35783 RepID=UPI002FC8A9E7